MSDAVRAAGRFSYDPASDKWDWDDDVFRLYGLEPGSITPTTEFVLRSKHPDDRDQVRELLEQVSKQPSPFSISFRLLGQDGSSRRVVLVGEGVGSPVDEAQVVEGYYIDLEAQVDREIEDMLEDLVEHRAVIEQAKGVLIAIYSLSDDQAFAMLRWWSSNRNIKVRELCTMLVDGVAQGQLGNVPTREAVDRLLHDLTA